MTKAFISSLLPVQAEGRVLAIWEHPLGIFKGDLPAYFCKFRISLEVKFVVAQTLTVFKV